MAISLINTTLGYDHLLPESIWRKLGAQAGAVNCVLHAMYHQHEMAYAFTVTTKYGNQRYHLSYIIPAFRLDATSATHAVNLLLLAMKGHIANGFTRFESPSEEGMLQAITSCH